MANKKISQLDELKEISGGEYIPVVSNGVTKKADTAVLQGDRTYDDAAASGLGRKILRKNWVDGKNVLTQDMMSDANTVYEIRYDFDLNKATITVPEGCVLEFKGGKVSNGKLTGNNTAIDSVRREIFSSVKFTGTFVNDFILPEWFGAYPNLETDIADNLQAIVDCGLFGTILFGQGTYSFSTISMGGFLNNRMRTVNLEGAGKNVTVLNCIATTGTEDEPNCFIRYGKVTTNVYVRDMTLKNSGNDYNDGIGCIHDHSYTGTSGGLWYANFERLDMSGFYSHFHFEAVDDYMPDTTTMRDVANQHLTFRDIVMHAPKFSYVNSIGQFGQQGGFYNCFFYDIPNTIDYAIYGTNSKYVNSTNGSDGNTVAFYNCSFVGSPAKALIRTGGPYGSNAKLINCDIEVLKCNLFNVLANNIYLEIRSCRFHVCTIPQIMEGGASKVRLKISDNTVLSCTITSYFDTSSTNFATNCRIDDDNSLEVVNKYYYRIYLANSSMSNFPYSTFFPSALENTLIDREFDGIVFLSLQKHSSVSRNVVLLKNSDESYAKWVVLSQLVAVVYQLGKAKSVIADKQLRGNSSDLEEINSVSKGKYIGMTFFNTDTNQMLFYTGSGWVDATGTSV